MASSEAPPTSSSCSAGRGRIARRRQSKRLGEFGKRSAHIHGILVPSPADEAGFVEEMRRFGHEYARKLLTDIGQKAPGGLAELLRRDLDPALLKQLETTEAGK